MCFWNDMTAAVASCTKWVETISAWVFSFHCNWIIIRFVWIYLLQEGKFAFWNWERNFAPSEIISIVRSSIGGHLLLVLILKYGWHWAASTGPLEYFKEYVGNQVSKTFWKECSASISVTIWGSTSHSVYDAMSTKSNGVKINEFLCPNFIYIPKK